MSGLELSIFTIPLIKAVCTKYFSHYFTTGWLRFIVLQRISAYSLVVKRLLLVYNRTKTSPHENRNEQTRENVIAVHDTFCTLE